MGFNCGIIGLPNVGKSTIFNALTNAGAQASNYAFCTIDPNVGIVPLPDLRLDKIAEIFKPKKITPTTMEFVDIAGLVSGASKGEGLGNQFLGHIRTVDAIAQVVRCFENPDVIHVHGDMDPINDIEVINTELILADLQSVTTRLEKVLKLARVGDKESKEIIPHLEKIKEALNQGKTLRSLNLPDNEKEFFQDLSLLTLKPTLYVCNVDEKHLGSENQYVKKVMEHTKKENALVLVICGSVESEIAQMAEEDKKSFLKDYGISECGLNRLTQAGYKLLGLATFFTAGPKEVRAWTITAGTKAPQAAGKIHSDFERGFIRAEIYHYEDLIKHGTEQKVRDAGLMRVEGKDYVIKDGDVIFFRFNV